MKNKLPLGILYIIPILFAVVIVWSFLNRNKKEEPIKPIALTDHDTINIYVPENFTFSEYIWVNDEQRSILDSMKGKHFVIIIENK